MAARFVQVHTLTNYPASLLNRDDAGFAKRMPFGGAVRTRISSQCLKRHWRVYDGPDGLGSIEAPQSVRSRESFERFVVAPLTAEGMDEALVRTAVQKIVGKLLGSEAKQERASRGAKKSAETTETAAQAVKTSQVTVLGRPELDYLRQVAKEAIDRGGTGGKVEKEIDAIFADREFKKNIQALLPGSLAAGLGAALFGRMVTGDILARTDAAVHVAHAMTVHGQMTESDYFSAIDDLVREDGEQSSGHINASELTSGLYYGYIVVDVPGLVSNLGGDAALAGEIVDRLIHIVAKVSPGAKLGSTAPYAYSHLVLVETGDAQPRTLANAFLDPVRTSGGIVVSAYAALSQHLGDLDEVYGKREERAHAGIGAAEYFENRMTLAELANWTRGRVAA